MPSPFLGDAGTFPWIGQPLHVWVTGLVKSPPRGQCLLDLKLNHAACDGDNHLRGEPEH